MADNRTGLSPADIAESFRDRCWDGSVEWVYTPTQTRVLLDAAELQAENAKLVMKLNAEHLARQNVERENAKLRELVVALYHVHFGTEEESWDAWEDFCPCSICEERHGGEAPCAYTSKDLSDECCEPITKEIVIDRMRELGVDA